VFRDYNTIIFFNGEKAKLPLWGDLAHIFNDEDIGKQTVIIITSVMIQSPRFKGTFFYVVYLLLYFVVGLQQMYNTCIINCLNSYIFEDN
jgi:hypothetical protein